MSANSRPDLLPDTFDGSLARLSEELHEVGIEIAHCQRFGWCAVDPETGIVYDNVAALFREVEDLEHAISEAKRLWAEQSTEEEYKKRTDY